MHVFFQINLGIYVNDSTYELSVLVDRATGGASIKDGEIELMLHRFCINWILFSFLCWNINLCQIKRYNSCFTLAILFFFVRRLLADDGKGVQEALDEQVCVEGKCDGLTVWYSISILICLEVVQTKLSLQNTLARILTRQTSTWPNVTLIPPKIQFQLMDVIKIFIIIHVYIHESRL